MTRESADTKAKRYLLEGRVIVTAVGPGYLEAVCRGEGHLWHQNYRSGIWSCDCPVRSDGCSHLHAVRRVVAVDLEDPK